MALPVEEATELVAPSKVPFGVGQAGAQDPVRWCRTVQRSSSRIPRAASFRRPSATPPEVSIGRSGDTPRERRGNASVIGATR